MEEFFLSESVNEGIKLPLYDAKGNKTDHYLIIVSTHNENFRRQESIYRRRASVLGTMETDEERANYMIDSQRSLAAHLVIGWSFEQECTHDNVVNFFIRAPQIQDQVDNVAARHSTFFENGLTSSSNGGNAN